MKIFLITFILASTVAQGFSERVKIGNIVSRDHGTKGVLYVKDSKTIEIENFEYDGTAPDAFFIVGTSDKVAKDAIPLPYPFNGTFYDFSDQNLPVVTKKFEKEKVVLTIPDYVRMEDLKWFSFWCRQYSLNFGDIMFPEDLKVPASVDDSTDKSSDTSNDLLVGRLSTKAHGVKGEVYVRDGKSLVVKNFEYDGEGPDAFFLVGNKGVPSEEGMILPYPFNGIFYGYEDENAPILTRKYEKEEIVLTLPDYIKVEDLKWLSVWCRAYKVNFGDIFFPNVNKDSTSVNHDDEIDVKPELPSPIDTNHIDGHGHGGDFDAQAESEPEAESKAHSVPGISFVLIGFSLLSNIF